MSPHRRSTDTPAARKRRSQVLLWGALGALGFVLFAVTIVIQQRAIQASREDTIRRSCEESNARHDKTIAELDRILLVRVAGESVDADTPPAVVERRLLRAVASLPGDRRAQIEQSRASTRLLIDALSPKRDCERRAQRLANPAQ